MTGSTNMSIVFKDRNLIKTMIDNSDYTKDLVIPSDVATIMDYAFYGRSGFKGRLILNEGLLNVGASTSSACFYGCSGFIGDLIIPNTVRSLRPSSSSAGGTFYGCSGFNGTLTLGTGLSSVGDAARGYIFNDCSGFKKLIISNNITSIGKSIFANCTGLTDVDCYRTTPPSILSNSFSNVTANFYVPANNIYAYKTATNWVSFAVRIMGRKEYIIDDTFEDFAQGSYTTTTWYASKEDLVAGTNPIASGTTVGASGTYYCTLT